MNIGVNTGDLGVLRDWLPFLIPYAVIYFGLMIAAVVHILTHKHYKVGNRLIWLAIAIIFQIIGPVLYFIIGRSDEEGDV